MIKFFNANQVELFDSITVSSGNGTKQNLYDRNLATKWVSVGSDDTTTETIEIIWASAKTIDNISLISHNLKEFGIQYWNGAAYVDFSTPISETTNTATSNLFSFNSVTTLKIKLSATKTITTNAQKQICEFLAYLKYFEIPTEYLPESENASFYYKQSEHEKVDGGSLLVIEATAGKYRNTFSWESNSPLPKTYRDYIKALKETHASFWLMPDDAVIADQYLCNLISDINFNRTAIYAGGIQCYIGSIEVKET